MSEIEVGDYVRINNDFRLIAIGIGKVVGINKDNIHVKMNFELPFSFKKENIANHDKQPIDLIEVKDLVCFKNKLQNSLENEEMIIHIFDNDTLEEVKQAIEKGEIELLEILTHEQFEANCYKVGGEE